MKSLTKAMEALLKRELNTQTLKSTGQCGGGCISNGETYLTDQGKVFVKYNSKKGSRLMFDGEAASLDAILATGTIRVPKPIKVFDNPSGGSVFVMEYLDMHSSSKYAAKLGEQMARLHLYNEEVAKKSAAQESSIHGKHVEYVDKFGFHVTTCCGFIPQDNTWCNDWVEFYTQRKLQSQLDLIEKEYHDRDANLLWPELQRRIPEFFKDIVVKPSLLHGDLWGGNVAETKDEPVIFDPASFYGHSEFELSIAGMFGGFGRAFYDAYHALVPKAPGFQNRLSLYKLFHYLNHWNHFGGGYRSQSIGIMRDLVRCKNA